MLFLTQAFLILGIMRSTFGALLDYEIEFPVGCKKNIERNVVGNKNISKSHGSHARPFKK
jgi:hypothetical protein